MQWSDAIASPKPKVLRQFAGLWLVFFCGLAVWRAWHGSIDWQADALASLGLVVGILGLLWPSAIRFIYTGWMIAAFPIGWTVSQLMLAGLYYLVLMPVALVFRVMRRDAMRLRPRPPGESLWLTKPKAARSEDYLRQS